MDPVAKHETSVVIRTKTKFPMTPSGMRKNSFLNSGSIHDARHDCAGSIAAPPELTVILRVGDTTVPVHCFMMNEKHANAVLAQIPIQYPCFGFHQVDDN